MAHTCRAQDDRSVGGFVIHRSVCFHPPLLCCVSRVPCVYGLPVLWGGGQVCGCLSSPMLCGMVQPRSMSGFLVLYCATWI